jgi:DNA invertase Pin-like site-specific DNA recombinase/transcription elongation GreA/GreB family factor
MSPKKKPERPIDIYVRVSKVGGREGDGFISPQEQEQRCRAQLAADRYEVGKVFVDLDESGATQNRPAFNEVMQRVRDGVSGGVCVARLNRFGRTTRGVLEDLEEIEARGAAFIAVEEKFDTSTSIGRFVLRMFASIGELELDRIREGWATTHASMIERGIQSGRVPIGYRKGEDRRLVPSEYAPIVEEAFRLRAEEGYNWHQLARFLTEQGLPTQTGGPWQIPSARRMIANRAYLGEVRHGDLVKKDAHQPLVDERRFRLANRKERKVSGERGDGPLLGGGLIRCATCGSAMVKSSTKKGKNGNRYLYLRCINGGESGHPTIAYFPTQEYLVRRALERLDLMEGEYVEATVDPELQDSLSLVLAEIEELDRQLEDDEIPASIYTKAMVKVEADRDALRDTIAAQEASGTVVQVNRRAQQERDAARQLLLTLVDPEAAQHASEVEPGVVPAARALLKETLGPVVVRPGRGKVEERVTIDAV